MDKQEQTRVALEILKRVWVNTNTLTESEANFLIDHRLDDNEEPFFTACRIAGIDFDGDSILSITSWVGRCMAVRIAVEHREEELRAELLANEKEESK